jgi:hypothetical protein
MPDQPQSPLRSFVPFQTNVGVSDHRPTNTASPVHIAAIATNVGVFDRRPTDALYL